MIPDNSLNWTCDSYEYTSSPFSIPSAADPDHMLPLETYGLDDESNLACEYNCPTSFYQYPEEEKQIPAYESVFIIDKTDEFLGECVNLSDICDTNNTPPNVQGNSSVPQVPGHLHDHLYVLVAKDETPVHQEVVEEEIVVPIEAPVLKRPVGRPRKNAPRPVKRSAYFDEDDEELVEVDSPRRNSKRARKSPKSKSSAVAPARKAHTKKPHAKKSSVPMYKVSSTDWDVPIMTQPDFHNPAPIVMRIAKSAALKNIARSKHNTVPAARNKRQDHNMMEKKRRKELKDLFDHLRTLVPAHLLVDDSKKAKKNPSKNTILVGAKHLISKLSAYNHRSKLYRKVMRHTARRYEKLWI